MNMVFVLIMIIGGVTQDAGIAVVQQDFSSLQNCESARKTIEAQVTTERSGSGFMTYRGRIYASACQPK